jgi:hypothetical protein
MAGTATVDVVPELLIGGTRIVLDTVDDLNNLQVFVKSRVNGKVYRADQQSVFDDQKEQTEAS